MAADPSALLRSIPQVDALMQAAPFAALIAGSSRQRVTVELRRELEGARRAARDGRLEEDDLAPEALATRVAARLARGTRSGYRRVINATGVVLHTGLGRSSLPDAALDALLELAPRPQRLEIDLESGERGGRDAGCARLLREILGCADATVVNNNAAATLVALAALAGGRNVVLSRGELVEIGGSYRIPEIIRQSGAELREVGTTNRTHLRDYEDAIDEDTGAVLKVHTSNYKVQGFTSAVGVEELVALGRARGVPVIHDLGSGCLVPLEDFGLPADQLVQTSVAVGVDLVCCSGDKLLGGPQAGILAGTGAAVEACRRHPLFRAVRPGRLIYTALEATLRLYLDGAAAAVERIPTLARLTVPAAVLEERARALAAELAGSGLAVEAVPCASEAGSGSLPLEEIASWGLRLTPTDASADELARRLRTGEPAVLARVRDGAVVLDLRTVGEDELDALVDRLAR
jgi:L-seryl-tRNA(Ser) seleniumtransferase